MRSGGGAFRVAAALAPASEHMCTARCGTLEGWWHSSTVTKHASGDREQKQQRRSVLRTPTCLAFSRRGAPAHLTTERLAATGAKSVQLTLHNLISNPSVETIRKYKEYAKAVRRDASVRVHDYINMRDFCLIVTQRDSLESDLLGATSDAVRLRTAQGIKKVTTTEYIKWVIEARPDVFCALADEVGMLTGKNRSQRSTTRSVAWLDIQLEQLDRHSSDLSPLPLCLAVITGGSSREQRIRCAREMSKEVRARRLTGYVLGGFGSGESPAERKDLISAIVSELPGDKLRAIWGQSTPIDVLEAVELGVDLFDSSYPTQLTENGYAWALDLDDVMGMQAQAQVHTRRSSKLNLRDKTYELDMRPLVESCECFTCCNHTRAYIHHLINTHEMLHAMLLQMHNVHHFMRFFGVVRDSIAAGRFAAVKQTLMDRLKCGNYA